MNSMILYKPPEALSVPVTHAGGPGSGIRSEVIKPATGHARGLESDLGSTARVRMPSEPTVIRLRRSGRWVVWGCPWPSCRVCGPYRTQVEALRGDGGLQAIKRAIRAERKGKR